MFARHLYYELKPFLPSQIRWAMKRRWARRKRAAAGDSWPIDRRAGEVPPGWLGWPGDKRFAFVLTHDVEGFSGVRNCPYLAGVEGECGFRSSFNFIPEGSYTTPPELRKELADGGFEIGVHDLHHDGKLFKSRGAFMQQAIRINDHLKAWGAVGFRAGFMLRNLDWIGSLEIEYDASTFDTDPFEPQPDGAGTIFPFWVPCPSNRRGYVELPYTLPQDSTLFISLGESTIDVWKQKLAWIVKCGGMAVLDTHPDYMSFNCHDSGPTKYPVALYREFLEHVRDTYSGEYWHALPREVARFSRQHVFPAPVPSTGISNNHQVSTLNDQPRTPVPFKSQTSSVRAFAPRKIWIDLDNTPHVPFFEPIIEALRTRGFDVFVTARDAFQVCELADARGLEYRQVGRHYGKKASAKVAGLIVRALQLMPSIFREKPMLAVSHGARSQILAANLLRVPTVLIDDYEYSAYPPLVRPQWAILPEGVPPAFLHCAKDRVRRYAGIKEDVYVGRLNPDPGLLHRLGIRPGALLVTVRPPATEAHYHDTLAEVLFTRFMDRAIQQPDLQVVLLPRNARQAQFIRSACPKWFADSRTIIPTNAIDGLNLLWHSDFAVGGGGTMNREAAALGVPVYSFFTGKLGAIDRRLEQEGRLVVLRSPEDIDSKIKFEFRPRPAHVNGEHRTALPQIVAHIEAIANAVAAPASRHLPSPSPLSLVSSL